MKWLAAWISACVVPIALAQHPAGSLDRSFGARGMMRWRAGSGEHEISALAMLPDGRTIASGHFDIGGQRRVGAVRLTAQGRLDLSFGSGGIGSFADASTFDRALAVASDGSIVIAGYAGSDLWLGRLHADGSPDASFGNGGVAVHDLGSVDDRPGAVLIERDGSIVVVGLFARGAVAAAEYDTYVARFDAHGARTSFRIVDGLRGVEYATRAVPVPGGLIVSGYEPSRSQAFVMRLRADDSLDPSFGDRGSLAIPNVFVSWALAIDGEGRALVGGQIAQHRAFVARLTTEGRLDPSWGTDGIALGGPDDDQLQALVARPDGSVIGAGFRGLGDRAFALIVRFDPSGQLDMTFGTNGAATARVVGGGAIGMGAAVGPGDRLVLGGDTHQHLFFARFWL